MERAILARKGKAKHTNSLEQGIYRVVKRFNVFGLV